MPEDPIIRNDDDGRLDEFIARGADIHLEAMGEAQFWIGVFTADGRHWHSNLGAINERAKGFAVTEGDR